MSEIIKQREFLDKDRIAVFVGKKGEMKREIEKGLNSKIYLDSQSGEVTIETEDSFLPFIFTNVVEAVNLGHNPKNTLKLMDENYALEVLNISEFIRDKTKVPQIMGRVIGKGGKTREAVHQITKCDISIKDNKISIIGDYQNLEVLHKGFKMLVQGCAHKTFYSYLEKNKSES